MNKTSRAKLFLVTKVLALIFIFLTSYLLLLSPSNNRNWLSYQSKLPEIKINNSQVIVQNVRNIHYRTINDFDLIYEQRTYDLNQIKTVDYIIVPFGPIGIAHTFLSFGFADGSYLAISVEARREVEEKFSAVKGLLRQYEIMYVVADEKDAIRFRTNLLKNKVYMYPIKSDIKFIKELFLSIAKRINQLKEHPEFYNTLFNNCTINVIRHANKTYPGLIPWSLGLILPEYSDSLALKLGLIEANENSGIQVLRKQHYITDIAQKYDLDPDFSKKIRSRFNPISIH